jgi:hypothetical protein
MRRTTLGIWALIVSFLGVAVMGFTQSETRGNQTNNPAEAGIYTPTPLPRKTNPSDPTPKTSPYKNPSDPTPKPSPYKNPSDPTPKPSPYKNPSDPKPKPSPHKNPSDPTPKPSPYKNPSEQKPKPPR